MRIRVVRNFGVYKEGQEFDWSDGMARLLVARGMIEPIPAAATPAPKPPVVEEAAAQPDVERAVDRHTRRPRK
jgi:hypothetical protein